MAIGRPDGDPFPRLQSQRQQCPPGQATQVLEFSVTELQPLVVNGDTLGMFPAR
ncbi:hypothetical protein D3C78_1876120 [compost metagenome]